MKREKKHRNKELRRQENKRAGAGAGAGSKTDSRRDDDEDIYIPDWFLGELLSRLGQKDVTRFRLVSKRWLSFISDPSFQPWYSSRLLPPFVFFPKALVSRVNPRDLKSSPEFHHITLPSSLMRRAEKGNCYYHREGRTLIRAADKGFVLLERHVIYEGYSFTLFEEFYICNFVTKQWFFPDVMGYFSTTQPNWGLIARVESGNLTSYKIVVVECESSPQKRHRVYVFSSSGRRRMELTVHCQRPVSVSSEKMPIVVNNTLYFFVEEEEEDDDDDDDEEDKTLIGKKGALIAYDPYRNLRRFLIIEPQEEIQATPLISVRYFNCGVFQERLKYFASIESASSEKSSSYWKIWELNQDDNNKWCLQHSINTEDIIRSPSPSRRNFAIQLDDIYDAKLGLFHSFDPDVVFLYCSKRKKFVMSYNMRTKTVGLEPRLDDDDADSRCSSAYYFSEKGLAPSSYFVLAFPIWPFPLSKSLYEQESKNTERKMATIPWW